MLEPGTRLTVAVGLVPTDMAELAATLWSS